MGDSISRQEAVDLIKRQTTIESLLNPKNDYERGWNDAIDHLLYAFKDTDALPSAQRKGHWVENHDSDHAWKCSECGCGYTDCRLSFCYDCGADMREEVSD